MPMRFGGVSGTSADWSDWEDRAYPFLPADDPHQEEIVRRQAEAYRAGELRNTVISRALAATLAEADAEEDGGE